MNKNLVEDIEKIYLLKKLEIKKRLNEFTLLNKKTDKNTLFIELAFCILTPQSKAKLCWEAITILISKNLLFNGTSSQISKELNKVRFKNKKAVYIVQAREVFPIIKNRLKQKVNPCAMREWLVKNIKGIGYKEASHFLRNIGLGKNIAILDRHILKNLKGLGVIKKIPSSLSKKQYMKIEKNLIKFAKTIKIPPAYLDLILWYKETGEIFK